MKQIKARVRCFILLFIMKLINKTLIELFYYNSFGDYGMTKTFSNNGDGTVPIWSADLNAIYPNKTYYAINRRHGEALKEDENTNIGGLIDSENVYHLVRNIINDSNAFPSGISKTKPYQF